MGVFTVPESAPTTTFKLENFSTWLNFIRVILKKMKLNKYRILTSGLHVLMSWRQNMNTKFQSVVI